MARVADSQPKQDYSRSEVLRLARISARQLSAWEKLGLVERSPTYGFQQLIALRTLAGLYRKKLPPRRIQAALTAIRQNLGNGDPLSELRLIVDGKSIHVQLDGQRVEPTTGQTLFDFDRATGERTVSLLKNEEQDREAARRRQREAEHWFLKGVELEQTAAPREQIIDAYQIAVSLDPRFAAALVNLGTVYFTSQDLGRAEKYYALAIEANPSYPLAHFNTANLWDERGDRAKALEHYLKALELDPNYADAHYNIALLYQNRGDGLKALHHWRCYLKRDSASPWAEVARREMNKLMATTVLRGKSTG